MNTKLGYLEGYMATVTTNDNQTKYTRLFPQSDLSILKAGIKQMVETNQIKDYKIEYGGYQQGNPVSTGWKPYRIIEQG